MTTTTTFQGMEPGAKNSSRVLRPPGGASNISFGSDEEKPVKKNKMASNIFSEPDDPHAHRRNNPPGGEASGVLCGEPSAPLRRCQPAIEAVEQKQDAAGGSNASGRRNPPGGKSSLILG
ncbi:hypothetical protein DNTS_022106 [Danionella cerebrum]|uniref:Uncharacterized protein n=1 Tax=Danionella cerebrum TaxID=2873325 RepID=A0A553R0H9_9TELE|nr:hypothetical protein DNTS_022106 [Danionella translucida]